MMRYFFRLILALYFLAWGAGAYAGLQEGLDAYRGGDYPAALKELTPLADKGEAAAQFTLGAMNNFGRGVRQDYAKAVMWYRKAAEQGYVAAQLNLGVMYGLGKGVPQNSQLAAEWYRRAIAQEKDNVKAAQTQATVDKVAEQAKREAEAKVDEVKVIEKAKINSLGQGNARELDNLELKLDSQLGHLPDVKE